ncbi:MAG TPA: hypothetical protein DIC22_12390, partial [Chitinophagaceae bacterium]|nr:hypothetical protein [Chitinophagaceae bacterium]
MKILTLGTLFCLIVLWSNSLNGQSVWTQHNDQDRTGWYPHETILDTSNVNQNAFGLQFSHTLDDKIMVQPLVVLNVNIPNKGIKNIVYVATLSNTVYAFDADANTGPYWQQNYTNSIAPGGPACTTCRPANNNDIFPSLCDGYYGDFAGNMGIIGTPVIDTTSGTMYFVSKIVNGNVDDHGWNSATPYAEYYYSSVGFHQYLHAIDITTGLDRPNSPVEITASVTGTGDGQTSTNIITFNPRTQFNRTGLALNNGNLYIAFAAHCDNNPSHGWVISYNASTLAFQKAMIVTPNDGRGGIWMSGTAPAIDPGGNLYFATGNSLDETPGTSNTGIIHL